VKELFRHPQIIRAPWCSIRRSPVHTPEWLWLSTGIRAVDHCVEGICSGEANPFADAQALHGLALLTRGLPRVKADPADLQAGPIARSVRGCRWARSPAVCRWGRATGSAMCSAPFSTFPHGHTSCIMLPAVMRWNKPVKRRAPGAGRRGDGPSRRGRGGRARCVHLRPRHAAQPRRRADRAGELCAAR